jgi:hypothetical protein
MHYSINPEEIKAEIEKLGDTVSNIWRIKQHKTKLPLSMCLVELKPGPNNKDIYEVEYLQQCKIKFEPPKHKRDIAECAVKDMAHKKVLPPETKMRQMCSNHPTIQCQRKERTIDVRCVVCGGNLPANYKGCMVYKDLQKKTYPPLHPKIYTPPAQTINMQPGVTYAQATKQNSYTPTQIDDLQYINQPHQQNSDIHELKNMMKGIFEQIGTMLNLLTTLLNKLK